MTPQRLYAISTGETPVPPYIFQRTIKLARLQLGENPDPEPGGWRRMKNVMLNEDHVELSIELVKPAEGKLKGFNVVHLTGTGKLALDLVAREELKDFCEAGGTLIVDAAGGETEFASSAQDELNSLIPGTRLQNLTADSRAFDAGGKPLGKVRYRDFAQRVVGGTQVPRIQSIQVKGRDAIFFSREDLSVGLVGHAVDGIIGYEPASATELMRRLLLASENAGTATTKGSATTQSSTAPAPAPATVR